MYATLKRDILIYIYMFQYQRKSQGNNQLFDHLSSYPSIKKKISILILHLNYFVSLIYLMLL